MANAYCWLDENKETISLDLLRKCLDDARQICGESRPPDPPVIKAHA
jgi:hypothetical protein